MFSFDFASIAQGFLTVMDPYHLLWLGIGVALGLFGGTVPGISGATMLAVLIAFTFKFPLDTMVIALAGIYAASVYSGSTSGILYNIPGDVCGIPTTIEGYPLTKKGRTAEALAADIGSSFVGATFGFVMMIILVPIFMYFVKFFGTGERALFALWALIIITTGTLTQEDSLRGMLSMSIGLILGMIGMQKNVGSIRFTMDHILLMDGLALVWVILGLFAIPQIIKLPNIKIAKSKTDFNLNIIEFYKHIISIIRKHWKLMLRSSTIGLVLGAIPGIGAVTASWVGYSEAQRMSSNPKEFGKGSLEGIIGCEASNNAAVPGTFIPLLALGIPGSAASAIILGAFIVAGVFPGPQMMATNAPLVWTILFGVGLSGFFFLLMGIPFIKLAQSLVLLPAHYIIATIGILTMIGTYLAKFNTFGIILTIAIGVVAMNIIKIGFSLSAILLGFVLGPVIEVEFIRAFQIDGIARFLRPASMVLICLIIVTIIWGMIRKRKANAQDKLTGGYDISSDDDINVLDVSRFSDVICALIGTITAIVVFISSGKFTYLATLWPRLVAVVFMGIPVILLILRTVKSFPELKNSLKQLKMPNLMNIKKESVTSMVIIISLLISVYLIDIIGFIESSTLFSFGCGSFATTTGNI